MTSTSKRVKCDPGPVYVTCYDTWNWSHQFVRNKHRKSAKRRREFMWTTNRSMAIRFVYEDDVKKAYEWAVDNNPAAGRCKIYIRHMEDKAWQ